MAIAFTSTTPGGTSGSYSVTVSGSNPLLTVDIFIQSISDKVTGVTWNGETLTRIISGSESGGNTYTYQYACLPVGSGAHNVVISLSSGTIRLSNANLYSGVPSLPTGGNFVEVATGTSTTMAPLTTPGASDWIIGSFGSGAGSVTVGSNTTFRSGPTGGFQDTTADSNAVASPTALAFNHNSGAGYGVVSIISPNIPSSIKTVNGLAKASVKTINGLAIASVKTFNGLA